MVQGLSSVTRLIVSHLYDHQENMMTKILHRLSEFPIEGNALAYKEV